MLLLGRKKSFVISRTTLYRGSLNRGFTVYGSPPGSGGWGGCHVNALGPGKKETARSLLFINYSIQGFRVFTHKVLFLFQKSRPVITKVEKLGDSPDAKPAADKAQDAPEVRLDNKETVSKEEEQEAELEGDTDTKTKRAAASPDNPEEQLEHLLAM